MGFFDDLLGKTGADASRRAAADTYSKQLEAANSTRKAGSDYQGTLEALSGAYSPYASGGLKAQNRVYDLLGLNGSGAQDTAYAGFRTDPGYQFQLDEGIGAIDRSAAARGMSNSGATLKALQKYGQGVADQGYGNYLQRLIGLGGQGLTATGQQVGVQSQGALGNLNAGLAAGNQMYGSAGTTGQGEIAAANSETAGAQNLANLGMTGLGYLTGNFGSSFGGSANKGIGYGTSANGWLGNTGHSGWIQR